MGKRSINSALIMFMFLCLAFMAMEIPFDGNLPTASVKSKPKTFEAKIHGGTTKSKSMALWEIHKYKDTELLRKSPLCYAPWKAYLAVDKFADVSNINNYNCLTIKTDLAKAVATDATFNRKFAKRFKGRSIERIYNYCSRTEYVLHVKTAREVFEKRQGDCAGISSAFYVICKTNNIPVRYIIGWCGNTCHAWNMVRVKGKWFYVDCTMDKYLSKKLWKHYSIMEKW